MDLLGYLASFAMGIVLGIMGGGGSILTVPILVYLLGISPLMATGYSLFIVGVTALIGGSMYIKNGEVNVKVGLSFAIPSIVGVNVSRGILTPAIPEVIFSFPSFTLTKEVLIMSVFALLMIAASYSMIKWRSPRVNAKSHLPSSIAFIGFQGLIVGMIAGFVGAGGGFLITPALILFGALSMRAAVGTSLMIIAAQSLVGFAGDLSRGASVNWNILVTVAGIASVGIVVGSVFAKKIEEKKLKTFFGYFVLLMGSVILIEQTHHIFLR